MDTYIPVAIALIIAILLIMVLAMLLAAKGNGTLNIVFQLATSRSNAMGNENAAETDMTGGGKVDSKLNTKKQVDTDVEAEIN